MEDKISIIIPTLNEEKIIADTLQHLKKLQGNKEIIVVDGGSTDQTVEIASKHAEKVIITKKGRGHQLNQGTLVSTGDILFFLHSDSRLEDGALISIIEACKNTNIIGGCLKLKIDDHSPILRLVSWTSNIRARYFKVIFGDQGVFVRKNIFEELNGYQEMKLMEDWEFSRRMSSRGQLAFVNKRIYTSSRRWHKFGVFKTIFLMHKLKVLYLLGTDPDKLYQLYRDAR